MDLLILVNAKKMGLNFINELALFRLRDFLEFTDIYFSEFDNESPGSGYVRNATQEDID